MFFCKNCGSQNNEGAKFCKQCGTPIGGGSKQANQETASTAETRQAPRKPIPKKPSFYGAALPRRALYYSPHIKPERILLQRIG